MKKTLRFIALSAVLVGAPAGAAPYLPASDGEVLERLPEAAVSAQSAQLRQLRAALRLEPASPELASQLAQHYIELGRISADPRHYGYAQAALAPWWDEAQPPSEILLLRATILQNRHDFDGALNDLARLLKRQPLNGQAWLTRAVVLSVVGDYQNALKSCRPLPKLMGRLPAAACYASIASLTGQAEQSYRLLQQMLQRYPQAQAVVRNWALTVLAEIAVRLGYNEDAERYFRQALALHRGVYLLSVYADFLLDQNRPETVRALLAEETRSDPLLLRLALAEQRLNSPRLSELAQMLDDRIAATRMRGDKPHLGDSARFYLHVKKQPDTALSLALQNWQQQREPKDTLLLLEAALSAGDEAAIQKIMRWLKQTGMQDVRMQTLLDRAGRNRG